MTRGELISQIKNELRINSADNRLTNRFIWSIIYKHLSWLIKRESSKLRLIRQDNIFQSLKCVDVEEAPAVDPCCGIRSKCTVHRTCEPIPKLFEDDYGIIIKSVLVVDKSDEFNLITLSEYIRKIENPHSKYDKSKYFFYDNGYLYFPKSEIRKVIIKGYFVDDVVNSCDEDTTSCKSFLDMEARVPQYILGELMNQVLTELTKLTMQIQPDDQVDKAENRKS